MREKTTIFAEEPLLRALHDIAAQSRAVLHRWPGGRSENLSDGARDQVSCLPVRGLREAGERTSPNGLKSCSGRLLTRSVNRETDSGMPTVDASFVAVAERLQIRELFTTDL